MSIKITLEDADAIKNRPNSKVDVRE